MKNRFIGNLALFLTALIWGLSFVAQRAGMDYIGPFTFNTVRSFMGALSLIPVILWVKYSKVDTRTRRRKRFQRYNLAKAGTACGIALFTAMTIQQYCMQYVAAGKAGFIVALYIIFVPIISVLFGNKLAKRIIASIFISVVGLYLLCYNADGNFSVYDLLLLASAFFYGVHIIVVDHFTARVNAVKTSCVQFLVMGLLSMIPMFLLETPVWSAIVACKVPLFVTGVLTCGIAYTLQIYGQKHTIPVVASLILCLESVFAVLGGFLILGETMTPKEITGCVLMITAVIIANTKRDPKA